MHILQQLLSNELLTEDTKAGLQQAFDEMHQQITESETARLETEIRTQLTEQFVQERNMLVEALDSKMGSILEGELAQLQQSIAEFRDLEVEFQTKIVAEKANMGEQLNKDLVALVHIVESFLEERLTAELTEFKQDIMESRKNDLGRRILEAFGTELVSLADPALTLAKQVDELTVEAANAKDAAKKIQEQYDQLNKKHSVALREGKLTKLLSQLNGSKREVMEQLLKDAPVDVLEEKFQLYLPRLIEQTVTQPNQPDVLKEGVQPTNQPQFTIKTGDVKNLSESTQTGSSSALTDEMKNELKRIAGIQ